MKITRFEELDCWKAARELVNFVYQLTSQEPIVKDFCLRDQMRRAAISTMANIAEGFGTRRDKEFARFLDYAIRSAIEVQSHLYVSLDQRHIDNATFDKLYTKAQDCANLSRGLIRYLQEKNSNTSTLQHCAQEVI